MANLVERGRGARAESEKLSEGALDRGVEGAVVEERLVGMDERGLREGREGQHRLRAIKRGNAEQPSTHMSPHLMRHKGVHDSNRIFRLFRRHGNRPPSLDAFLDGPGLAQEDLPRHSRLLDREVARRGNAQDDADR